MPIRVSPVCQMPLTPETTFLSGPGVVIRGETLFDTEGSGLRVETMNLYAASLCP